ncbi:hypothetical protein [Mesorhizobium kowhaii]|uniref:Uncharacterized protein n=1 Tax=Mesorhizobium kowhaii TaxID=1300272 RepID=A0A2W7BZ65_9HYPH|nr:hypothetical protein [Mesorhizobium kowhaii]PZV36135.1 hypothetical protein B5V02_23290 [Mesorhizobium kowhaii]
MGGFDLVVVQAIFSAVWLTALLMLVFWMMNFRSSIHRENVSRSYQPEMREATPESEEIASIPFKIRATFPGRISGIKEWTPEEINLIITSYKERYPEE